MWKVMERRGSKVEAIYTRLTLAEARALRDDRTDRDPRRWIEPERLDA